MATCISFIFWIQLGWAIIVQKAKKRYTFSVCSIYFYHMQSRDKSRLIIKLLFQMFCKLQDWVIVQGVPLEDNPLYVQLGMSCFCSPCGWSFNCKRQKIKLVLPYGKINCPSPKYLFYFFFHFCRRHNPHGPTIFGWAHVFLDTHYVSQISLQLEVTTWLCSS